MDMKTAMKTDCEDVLYYYRASYIYIYIYIYMKLYNNIERPHNQSSSQFSCPFDFYIYFAAYNSEFV